MEAGLSLEVLILSADTRTGEEKGGGVEGGGGGWWWGKGKTFEAGINCTKSKY